MASQARILVAEDEESDRFLLKVALKRAGILNGLIITRDGHEAVDYLTGQPPYDDRVAHPLPGLFLLDLKMPRMNGFEVLAWLATRPEFQYLPVIVLSSSSYDSDKQKAHDLGARDYFLKPHDFQELAHILKGLSARWLTEAPQTA